MMMEKSNKETIREYTHRWKNKAMHVQPPLLEKKMVTLFTDTFKSLYYEHLMGSFTQYFYDIVSAERIEQGIKDKSWKNIKTYYKKRVCMEEKQC
jgi:hypothetical protein